REGRDPAACSSSQPTSQPSSGGNAGPRRRPCRLTNESPGSRCRRAPRRGRGKWGGPDGSEAALLNRRRPRRADAALPAAVPLCAGLAVSRRGVCAAEKLPRLLKVSAKGSQQ
ncbi:unnamed protein product, partial [Ixodes persulcatus]